MDFKQQMQSVITKAQHQDSLNNQGPHLSNGIETIAGKNKLTWLWESGRELFATKWIRDWGDAPTEIKAKTLGKLSANDIKQGFAECIKQAQNGKQWPPTPIEFIALCQVAGIDIDGSFDRMIKKQPPANEAEKITRYEVGYNCRVSSDEKARQLWAKYYRVNFKKMKEGALKIPEQKLLTEHVAAKPTDTMRDNFKPKTQKGAEIMNRINKIRSSKK